MWLAIAKKIQETYIGKPEGLDFADAYTTIVLLVENIKCAH